MNETAVAAWAKQALGHRPQDPALFLRAFTHASYDSGNYERLEFLGDRVLGLVIGAWLYEAHPDEPEGKLSHRLNALVSRKIAAEIGREIGVPDHLRLGKQARDDGVVHSDNVVGDVVEALIGALYVEGGLSAADAFIRRAWAGKMEAIAAPPKHPKAMLQEWAAANGRRPPLYELRDRSGPDHAPRFSVRVSVRGLGEADGTGASKQEAEKDAAARLLEKTQ